MMGLVPLPRRGLLAGTTPVASFGERNNRSSERMSPPQIPLLPVRSRSHDYPRPTASLVAQRVFFHLLAVANGQITTQLPAACRRPRGHRAAPPDGQAASFRRGSPGPMHGADAARCLCQRGTGTSPGDGSLVPSLHCSHLLVPFTHSF